MNESEQNVFIGEEAFIDAEVLAVLGQKEQEQETTQLVNELDEYEQAMAA